MRKSKKTVVTCHLLFLSLNFFLCLHSTSTLPTFCPDFAYTSPALCSHFARTIPGLGPHFGTYIIPGLVLNYFMTIFLSGLVLISVARSSFLTILYRTFLFNYVICGLKLYIVPACPIIEKVSHLAIFGLFYFVLLLLLFFTLLNCSF